MKKALIILLFIFTAATSYAQQIEANQLTKIEANQLRKYDPALHDAVMADFQRFYNNKMDDSINAMFSDELQKGRTKLLRFWRQGECANLMKKYGEIKSFKYIGYMDDAPEVKLYKVVAAKSIHVTGISVDKEKKLYTFRFATSSEDIDKLLKANK